MGTVTLSARWYRSVNVAWSISPLRFFRPFGVPFAVAISIRLFDPRVPSKVPNGSQRLTGAYASQKNESSNKFFY
jgi:hypothetical protein